MDFKSALIGHFQLISKFELIFWALNNNFGHICAENPETRRQRPLLAGRSTETQHQQVGLRPDTHDAPVVAVEMVSAEERTD